MKVLVLGRRPSPLGRFIRDSGCRLLEAEHKIDTRYIDTHKIDFIVSYRYRHIISQELLDRVNGRAVNLHISLLPWNRGADPNFWSFLDDTPKGVTIHYMDAGIDTGDIIAQKELFFEDQDATLESTYQQLNLEIVDLFKKKWPDILGRRIQRIPQTGAGSIHRTKDLEAYAYLLREKGWQTPVRLLKRPNA